MVPRLVATVAMLLALAAPASAQDKRGIGPSSPNPTAGESFYVDTTRHPAWRQYRRYREAGQAEKARLMWVVAREPKFQWFGRWNEDASEAIRAYLDRAELEQPGSVPLVATLRHQGKRCGNGYTAGGPREDALTKRWYDDFARGIGDSRVVIAFEPDSLGTLECLGPSRRKSRLDNLRYGVDVLSRLPNATIYIEGGASDWEPARKTARQLRYVGIRKVRGFMLNVTHHDWTASNVRHGAALSRLTGGKHFIVNTSFNGRGPVHYKQWIDRRRNIWRRINVWCHPGLRGLGPVPTTATHHPKADGYHWIGRPGYSGGSCNGGPLPIGSWWPARALMYARLATDWLRPPRGTIQGHFRRYPLRLLTGE
jgi:endoglucanase